MPAGLYEPEWDYTLYALEIADIARHKGHPRFAARQGEENVVAERLGCSTHVKAFLPSERRKHITGRLPRAKGWSDESADVDEGGEDVFLKFPQILSRAYSCPQLLSHYRAQILKRAKDLVELLQFKVRRRIPEPLNEEIAVEEILVFSPAHGRSRSGGVMSTPSIAAVPATSR